MTNDSGLIVGDERIGDPRTRPTKYFGGRTAKIIRRRDDRIGVIDATTGDPLGLLISEVDASRLDQQGAELAPLEDDGLGAMRGLALAAFLGLALIGGAYAIWHHGRWYEHEYGTDSRWSRH